MIFPCAIHDATFESGWRLKGRKIAGIENDIILSFISDGYLISIATKFKVPKCLIFECL